jgi:hypothetical protein
MQSATGKRLSKAALSSCIEHLEAEAWQNAPVAETHVRVAFDSGRRQGETEAYAAN